LNKELAAMSNSSTPAGDGNAKRSRPRGAIRTHLGRKRTGPRVRSRSSSYDRYGEEAADRRREEDHFDRLLDEFRSLFASAGETTLEAVDRALQAALDGLVSAGEFTVESGERLREFLRRDVLQRDNPALTFRTGDITSAGVLTCTGCGWTIQTTRTAVLPPCPHCRDTAYRKGG
jgi:hypothetical protein